MTKEALMEDLVKRSADGSTVMGGDPNGEEGSKPVWMEVGLGEGLRMFSGTTMLTLLAVALVVSLVCLICVFCCAKRGHSHPKKKKHLFGVKKAHYFREKMMSQPPRNPPPVINPDKGSHYLKKSPSPTGAKSPPGGSSNKSAEDYVQRKAALTSSPHQGSGAKAKIVSSPEDQMAPVFHEANENHPPGDGGSMRRASSGLDLDHMPMSSDSILGRLHCTVKYCFDKNALIVTINKCQNLPVKDMAAKSSDPYVKLQLLPEKQHKVKTRVMRRTLNPCYDEDFTFYGISFNQVPDLTLHFVVLSFDRYSRDDVIGEVMVDLGEQDLSSSDHHPIAINREITPRSLKLKAQGRGEILVSLCYQPAANRITAVVLKARNLPKMDITGLSDPYVKIYLLYNNQRIAKKKTHVKKRTLNPVFNESFVFDLPHLDDQGLKNISLEFLLLDWDRVTKNEVIGRLDLGGLNCAGTALQHWNEVITSPRRQIAEWHKLQE
eukprot:maker-scaffold62_size438377-snap-gene-2.13 protein:Tk07851 transcript:maker-scaffold62_size438377-snap-gene-2.13-mRNA-1 annotation:"synaptotagmin iv"